MPTWLEVVVGFVVPLGAIGAALGSAWLVASWVLRPLDRAAKDRRHPSQFTMADFLCLFVIMQAWMAFVHGVDLLRNPYTPGVVAIFDIFGWVSFALVWWYGGQTLSRAGVRWTWHRAALLALVIPLTAVATMAVPILAVAAVGSLIARERNTALLSGLAEAGTITAVYLFGLYVRWILRLLARNEQPVSSG